MIVPPTRWSEWRFIDTAAPPPPEAVAHGLRVVLYVYICIWLQALPLTVV
jgi:hypothetical protein